VNADINSTRTDADALDTSESEATETPGVSALKAELAAERARFLRLAADFDNFRKRVTQESERRAAVRKKAFIQELLPIIDNLERAVGSGPSTSGEQLLQGVEMTLQQLNRLLRAHGVEPEESVGQPFDPHYHEAVASRYDPSQPDHVVLETFQRGYRYGKESLRPAKVVVNDHSRAESETTAAERGQ
jgi:molecular chaperone GrpE